MATRFHLCGRKRITSPETDTEIVNIAKERKFVTATEIGQLTGVNRRTVGKRLKENGLFCCRPALKTELTQAHRDARIAFIEQNYHIDWDKVVFSDEKVFKSYSDRMKVLYRPKNHRYHPDYVQHFQFSGRITCGLWGFITAGGVGELCEITSRMNSTEYVSILDEVYVPSMKAMYGDSFGEFQLMQDNARAHTSNETRQYFITHPDIQVLRGWPARSPDMNIIENVWGRMTINWHIGATRNKESILDEAKRRWDQYVGDSNYIASLYSSIPRRFDEILQNNGYNSSY